MTKTLWGFSVSLCGSEFMQHHYLLSFVCLCLSHWNTGTIGEEPSTITEAYSQLYTYKKIYFWDFLWYVQEGGLWLGREFCHTKNAVEPWNVFVRFELLPLYPTYTDKMNDFFSSSVILLKTHSMKMTLFGLNNRQALMFVG